MAEPPDIRMTHRAKDTDITVRTMTLADRDIEAEFVRRLSAQSRYFRFHSALRELTPDLLERFIHVSYPANMALIATVVDGGRERQVAVARYVTAPGDPRSAEIAVVVADEWQGVGLGTLMLTELRDLALAGGIRTLHMSILRENRRMLSLARQLGFNDRAPHGIDAARELGKSIEPGQEGG